MFGIQWTEYSSGDTRRGPATFWDKETVQRFIDSIEKRWLYKKELRRYGISRYKHSAFEIYDDGIGNPSGWTTVLYRPPSR